jgi:hypothetical protein
MNEKNPSYVRYVWKGRERGKGGWGGRGRYSTVRCRHCYKREKKLLKLDKKNYPKISRISQTFFSFIYRFLTQKARKGSMLML